MLSRVQNFSDDGRQMVLWQELGEGAADPGRLCPAVQRRAGGATGTPRRNR